MLQFVIFALTVIIVLIAAVIFLLPGGKKVTTVPGPEPVDSLEGNFPDIQSSGSVHEFLTQTHSQYGKIVSLFWGPQLAISIASLDLLKQHNHVWDRPACIYELFQPLFGEDSLLFANGVESRKRNGAYSKCFDSSTMPQYYQTVNKLSAQLVEKWLAFSKADHVPLRREMLLFAVKAMVRVILGESFDNEKIVQKLGLAYEFTWFEMENRLHGGITEASRHNLNRFDEQVTCMRNIVEEALKVRQKNRQKSDKKLIIDVILDSSDSDSMAVSDTLTVLILGLHTTGFFLTWLMYYIADNSDVQARLLDEFDMVLGDKSLTPDNFKDLKYLLQVIKETLRCSILTPYRARVENIDTELGGHRIPSGTPVIHALGVMLHDPDVYPNPERFDPDRFADDLTLSDDVMGLTGGRHCPGYLLALTGSGILLVNLFRRFKVSLIEDQLVVPEYGLVTRPKEEIWISVRERGSDQ